MTYGAAIRHYDNTGQCLHSDLVQRELKIDKRITKETEESVVFHPFASHLPLETWVMPKTHQASFGNVSEQNLKNLAHVLRIILLKLCRWLDNPDFNSVIDTAPVGDENKDYYLCQLRMIPRLTQVAGFGIDLAFASILCRKSQIESGLRFSASSM